MGCRSGRSRFLCEKHTRETRQTARAQSCVCVYICVYVYMCMHMCVCIYIYILLHYHNILYSIILYYTILYHIILYYSIHIYIYIYIERERYICVSACCWTTMMYDPGCRNRTSTVIPPFAAFAHPSFLRVLSATLARRVALFRRSRQNGWRTLGGITSLTQLV